MLAKTQSWCQFITNNYIDYIVFRSPHRLTFVVWCKLKKHSEIQHGIKLFVSFSPMVCYALCRETPSVSREGEHTHTWRTHTHTNTHIHYVVYIYILYTETTTVGPNEDKILMWCHSCCRHHNGKRFLLLTLCTSKSLYHFHVSFGLIT